MKYYFIFLLILVSACNTSKISTREKEDPLIAARARVPGITLQQLTAGSKIYTRDCSGCHQLHNPLEYTTEQWHPILTRMFVKAQLNDSATKALITNYVIAKSK